MSSAPSGLDSREYGYNCFFYEIPNAFTQNLSCDGWRVTRIQYYAAAAAGSLKLRYQPAGMPIAAGGSLCLEPNGAYRGLVQVSGEGAVVLVEYWYQSNPNGPPILRVNGIPV